MRPDARSRVRPGLPPGGSRRAVEGRSPSDDALSRGRRTRIWILVAGVLLLPLVSGCGGSGGTSPAPPAREWNRLQWNQGSWR